MFKETELLLKIIQQSNNVITNSVQQEILDFYRNLLMIEPTQQITALDGRQPITLEIQHVVSDIVNKYAVTDKADGDRQFLIIYNNKVYFITTNLRVKFTGITLPDKLSEYNGSLIDGELIFIPSENRHIYLAFDCLFHKSIDIRPTIQLMERIKFADDIIANCFIFGKQKGFVIGHKKLEMDKFDLNKKVNYHFEEIKDLTDALNHDIKLEKQYPLIRRKYFIEATGAKDWEIFSYSSVLWNSIISNAEVENPYHLDGLILQPLEQSYATSKKDNKLVDYKWKPPEKNSIDFYLEYEKDQAGNPLIVYDNSMDHLGFVRNKPYKICRLYVGQQNKGVEVPVLFKESQELYLAYMYLHDGEVRDVDGNIISDKTVIEAYYNDDPDVIDKFRWVVLRTRYDKTDSVVRFNKKYGNYSTVADKVWRSITNPVLMSDFDELSRGNNPNKNNFAYDKKMEKLREKIDHELIISTTKESAYFQQRTNLVKPMRQFINWIKDSIIWTYCHPMYQDNRQLSVLDLGCGKGQDIMKWVPPRIASYVGVDIDREGFVNPVDGFESRYKQQRKRPNFPKMTFIQADAGAELTIEAQKRALNIQNLHGEQHFNRIFSPDPKRRTLFDRVSCMLAMHYFLRNEDTWANFKNNLNSCLRNGGYYFALTFDGRRIVELLGENNSYTEYYTDDTGKTKILFDIVRKYDAPKDKKYVMGVGNAIDVYISWFSLEGRYLTEYLVDSEYIVNDLQNDCSLRLICTDSCENQYNIHSEYLTEYAKYEDIERTRKYLGNVADFYKTTEMNVNTRKWFNLFRYYVFVKDGKTQKGGSGDDTESIDFSDSSKFYVPSMGSYDNKFSCTNSIHHIMRSHRVIPHTIKPNKFYNDLGIGAVDDTKVADKMQNIANNMIVSEIIDEREKNVIDGVNVFVVERDCNDFYDVDLVEKKSKRKNNMSIILMKEGQWYVPVYYVDQESHKKIGLFQNDHELIKKLMTEV